MSQNINTTLVSSLFAVRDALISIQQESLYNKYQEEMVGWAFEAEKKINSWRDNFEQKKVCRQFLNNRIQLPDDYYGLREISIGGKLAEVVNAKHCRLTVGSPYTQGSCSSSNCGNGATFCTYQVMIEQGFIVGANGVIPDGLQCCLVYDAIPRDENGYPMVFQEHINAISYYVQYRVLRMLNNPNWQVVKGEWLMECGQARARTNAMTPQDMARLGNIWWNKTSNVYVAGINNGNQNQF